MTRKKPTHLLRAYGVRDFRAWRRAKRKECRKVLRALKDLRLGCAHIDGGVAHVDAIKHHIDAMLHSLKDGVGGAP